MITPTVPLYSLCSSRLSAFSSSLTQSFWFYFLSQYRPLSGFSSSPSLSLSSVVHLSLSAPDCESALLWQFCCRALLTCMCCCIAMSSSMAPHHPKCLACACSASPATWQCWTHAPSTLWPGLPKEPPQANSTFDFIISAHSAPHTGGLWSIGFEWSHICLEYLFVFSAEPPDMTLFSVELISFFCKKNHYTLYRFNLPPPLWLILFCTWIFSVYKCSLNTADNLLLMTWIANNNCVWVWNCVSECVDQIILICLISFWSASIFISATERYFKSLEPRGEQLSYMYSNPFNGCH